MMRQSMPAKSMLESGNDRIAPAIDKSYENAIIGLLACATGLVFLNRGGIAFLFPPIKPEFDLNNKQLDLLIAVTALTWGLSSVTSRPSCRARLTEA